MHIWYPCPESHQPDLQGRHACSRGSLEPGGGKHTCWLVFQLRDGGGGGGEHHIYPCILALLHFTLICSQDLVESHANLSTPLQCYCLFTAADAPVMTRCPLCHTTIPPREDGWRQHLLVTTCPNHPRKKHLKNPGNHLLPAMPLTEPSVQVPQKQSLLQSHVINKHIM
ncbi:hypothetical protein PR048_029470 [Dryococelus australis]|uniref:Uncharacterized protein n=1 Tax=Dryococelus australis TaxID=614101 RepID=A0ABQ9GFW1_9NEOP|nr:hypothetical protein PR048_029470 [Dryococelus australis]